MPQRMAKDPLPSVKDYVPISPMDHPLPTTPLPDDAERLERQTRMLAELAELGVRVARVVAQQVEEAKFVGGDGDIVLPRHSHGASNHRTREPDRRGR